MLDKQAITQFESLVADTEQERGKVRHLTRIGKWKEAEPDAARASRFRLKDEIKRKQNGAESQIGDTLDWVDVSFLIEAARVQQAVGYVKVLTRSRVKTGSGFMISNSLFITNNHVIETIEDARSTTVEFNRQTDETGNPCPVTEFHLDPDA